MKRILVAYDDTEPARRAIERAAELAKAFDSEVIVGTREPGLVERLMRHSVSAEVARRVHRDLLIVHPTH